MTTVQLTQADTGRTFRVRVGTVLVAPLMAAPGVARLAIYRTSNPTILARAEAAATFQARHAGAATLSRPVIACGIRGAGQRRCPKPWWVRVVVT